MANSQTGPISDTANALSQNLLTSGQQFIQGLQGQASGLGQGVGDAIGGLLQFGQTGGGLPGTGFLQNAAASAQGLLGPNPALGAQTAALQDAIQSNLAATTGTIAGQATLGGSTGGSRQALATGQEAQRQFGQGAANLFSQDFATRQQLAPQLVGQQIAAGNALNQAQLGQGQNQLQALLGAGNLGNAGQQGQVGAAGVGLGALPGQFDLGIAPFGAEFSPLMALSQIIGRPTVLTESSNTSSGSGSGFSFGF